MRRSLFWVCFVAPIVSGCYAWREVPRTPTPAATVRVVFRTSQTLSSVPVPGDTVVHTYGGVMEAKGVVRAAAADSFALALGELRSATGPIAGVDGRVVMIASSEVARFEERRFQAGASALAGIGAASVALTVMIAVAIGAVIHSF